MLCLKGCQVIVGYCQVMGRYVKIAQASNINAKNCYNRREKEAWIMSLFLMIGIVSVIGIVRGIKKNNKRLIKTSFVALVLDIALFITGSIMYAIYE